MTYPPSDYWLPAKVYWKWSKLIMLWQALLFQRENKFCMLLKTCFLHLYRNTEGAQKKSFLSDNVLQQLYTHNSVFFGSLYRHNRGANHLCLCCKNISQQMYRHTCSISIYIDLPAHSRADGEGSVIQGWFVSSLGLHIRQHCLTILGCPFTLY